MYDKSDAGERTLRIEHRDGVDWLTLDRPHKLNALDDALIAELNAYFLSLPGRGETRVVVIEGAGRAFCAGLDLDEVQSEDARTIEALLTRQKSISGLILAMRRAPQPIISLVQGAACGGGFAIALASDIRIAGRSARMNAAFIRMGLSGCDVGVSYLLPRLVGASVASELLLTGHFIAAERALAVGLVSAVVDDDQLAAAAAPYLEAMLEASPMGLRMTKECLRMSIDASSLDAAIEMEDRTQVLCAMGALGERVAAFRQRKQS
jgi:enoyl-CoA hydratase/carnithine racemase